MPSNPALTATLPAGSASVHNRSTSRLRRGPEGPGALSSPLLEAAARRVATQWGGLPGDGADREEVTELLALLANGVHLRQTDAAAPVDQRLCSVLGRRLLDLLRAEVVRGWMQNGAAHPQMRALFAAIENMREAIEPNWVQDFTPRLSGLDGVELVVDIAHDLRSPLTSILFLAETLKRGQSGTVTPLQRRQLGLIYAAALGLSSVASDVIELARGGDQLVEKEPEPFSVTAVLESVRDIVSPIAEEKHLAVRVLPPATDHRLGHPIALSRVLLNLTTNALKFTDQGCVDIATKETAPNRIEFSVRDSGDGIDPAVVANLYQPFRRSNGQRRRCFSDTGLGLTMCRKLVEAMSSELKVETRRGWGTRFFFELDLPPYGRR
jgi:signal transduction histidine kinase